MDDSLTRFFLSKRWPIVLLLCVQLLAGVILSPLRAFFPIYVNEQLHYTATVVSTIVAAGQFIGMMTAIVGGTLSDSIGHKWTLALGLTGVALGSSLYFTRAPWLVVALWITSIIGMTLITLGGQSYLIATVSGANLGALSALYNWGSTLGGALSNPGAGWLLDHYSFGALGWALLIISVMAALVAAGLLPRHQQTATATTAKGFRAFASYGTIIRRPPVLILGMLRFLPTCYWGMASVLIPLLIKAHAGNNTAVAMYTTSSLVIASLAQIITGRAADRWGRRTPTLIAFGALTAATVGLALFARTVWGIYTFGILGASAAWSLSTLMPSLISEASTTEERGRVLGVLHLLWNTGMIVGSLLGGALVEVAVGLPFAVAALLNVVAIVLTVTFFRLIAHDNPPVPAT